MIDGLSAVHTIYPNAFEKVTLLSKAKEGRFIQAEELTVQAKHEPSGSSVGGGTSA